MSAVSGSSCRPPRRVTRPRYPHGPPEGGSEEGDPIQKSLNKSCLGHLEVTFCRIPLFRSPCGFSDSLVGDGDTPLVPGVSRPWREPPSSSCPFLILPHPCRLPNPPFCVFADPPCPLSSAPARGACLLKTWWARSGPPSCARSPVFFRTGGRAGRFVFVPPNQDGFRTVRQIVGLELD